MVTTRGLQEWACLLPGELPFASAARWLSWETQEAAILSDTTLCNLVKTHGCLIRETEAAEVEALWQHPELLELQPVLVDNQPARLRASFARTNSCKVARWQSHTATLPPFTLVTR